MEGDLSKVKVFLAAAYVLWDGQSNVPVGEAGLLQLVIHFGDVRGLAVVVEPVRCRHQKRLLRPADDQQAEYPCNHNHHFSDNGIICDYQRIGLFPKYSELRIPFVILLIYYLRTMIRFVFLRAYGQSCFMEN